MLMYKLKSIFKYGIRQIITIFDIFHSPEKDPE